MDSGAMCKTLNTAQMEDHLQRKKMPNLSGFEYGGFEGFGMLHVLDKKKKSEKALVILGY